MSPRRRTRFHRGIAGLALALAGASGHAAGGHFDVDDATVLDPGHCGTETWLGRSPSESSNGFHQGGACRIGPVELGLNADHYSNNDGSLTTVGPQIKWVADPLIDRLSAGLVWAVAADVRGGEAPSETVYVPLTLWSGERVQIHLNGGVDWQAGYARTRRWGASAEWAASDLLTVITERSLIVKVWSSRLGMRWNLSPRLSLDFSLARRSTAERMSYVAGLNRDFDLN